MWITKQLWKHTSILLYIFSWYNYSFPPTISFSLLFLNSTQISPDSNFFSLMKNCNFTKQNMEQHHQSLVSRGHPSKNYVGRTILALVQTQNNIRNVILDIFIKYLHHNHNTKYCLCWTKVKKSKSMPPFQNNTPQGIYQTMSLTLLWTIYLNYLKWVCRAPIKISTRGIQIHVVYLSVLYE